MVLTGCSSVNVSKQCPARGTGHGAGPTVVRLRGVQDVSTDPALCRALARAIAVDDAAVVVDLSEAEPMGLSTLAVIVRAREFLRFWSRPLTVRSPSSSARRLIGICLLKDLLGPEKTFGPGTALASWVEVPTTTDRRNVPSATGDRWLVPSATVDRRLVPSATAPARVSEHASQGGDLGVIDLRPVDLGAERPARTA
jgi:anti-anti-sigma regulatory factor